MGKDVPPPPSKRPMRAHRPTNAVPRWGRVLGVLAMLVVVGGWCLVTFPVHRSGAKTCSRCGAVESGPEVLGIWFGTERPMSPGRALVERVARACATHRYEATGCWS